MYIFVEDSITIYDQFETNCDYENYSVKEDSFSKQSDNIIKHLNYHNFSKLYKKESDCLKSPIIEHVVLVFLKKR